MWKSLLENIQGIVLMVGLGFLALEDIKTHKIRSMSIIVFALVGAILSFLNGKWFQILSVLRKEDKCGGMMDDFGSKLENDVLFTLDRIRSYERNKAIDEFVEKICEKYTEEERKGNYKKYCGEIKQNIDDIAEQLKG